MAASKTDVIYPCYFSKAYGIPTDQAWILLRLFFIYRVLLASVFLTFVFFPLEQFPFGPINYSLYRLISISYFTLTIITGIILFSRWLEYTSQAQFLIFTDIIAIPLIMLACGGTSGNIGILLVMSITFSGILIGGRCAMLFAALATLAMLSEQTYLIQTQQYSMASYTEAGLLGAACFTTALLAYILAQRSEQNQLIAQQHKQTILKLEELNQSIIQHLQSGIIITNRQHQIQLSNQTALRILNLEATPAELSNISIPLAEAFESWLGNSEANLIQIETSQQNHIHSRFSLLPTAQEMLYMIMLEDVALYNQRLQQSKLASLGRLTASIAHEIRNPLGAISHAGQLLMESPQLGKAEQRLLEIMQTHTQRINSIIEEILQLSRRKTSERHKVSVNNWLKDFLQQFITYRDANPEQFSLKLSKDNLLAFIDPDHLEQIMNNLCENALKHNSSVSPRLIIRTERNMQGIWIYVIDNGEGISRNNLEHLFEPFFTTSTSGTGLGLYICKELAELNQATLSYHPREPHSTNLTDHEDNLNQFRLCLPDAQQPGLNL